MIMYMKINILMCGSDFSVGGGMVTVAKVCLNYQNWNNDIHYTYIPTHINGTKIQKIKLFYKALVDILKLVKNKKIDIAHLHVTENGSFYRKTIVMFLLQKYHVKVILHHHIDYTEFYEKSNMLTKKIIRKTLEKADLNIVLGKVFNVYMKALVQKAKVKVIYNGVDVPSVNMYNANSSHILFLGWFNERKGIREVLEAIKQLDDEGFDNKIKIILCGEPNEYVNNLITSNHLEDRIGYIGKVSEEERNKLFKTVFVNLLPSRKEGLPMSIIESMAYGIPCIASNVGAIPEIIDDTNGILIDSPSSSDLKEAIKMLWNNKALRSLFSQKSYEKINEKFTIMEQCSKLEKEYERFAKIVG